MLPSFSKILLASLALVSSVKADYYIDDQVYPSLVYSGNSGASAWVPIQQGGQTLTITLGNGTLMTVSAAPCYNYTYIYAPCTVTDNCQVQIPFSGSGITIYVLQAGSRGINATIAIDEVITTDSVLPAPPAPNYYDPRVALFSIQGMTSRNHTAIMTIQSWENTFSGMMFDYALINQTIVSNSGASSTLVQTTLTPTATATSSPSNSTINVGAVVGGTLGGLATIAALFALFYLYRHRREVQKLRANPDVEPIMDPSFSPESLYRQRPQWYEATGRSASENPVTSVVNAQAPSHATGSSRSRFEESQLGAMRQIITSSIASSTQASSSTPYQPASPSLRPRVQQTHSMLTDDQADFINNLYANNVPAGAIARVIERMMAGERQPSVDGYESFPPLPPPSYHHGPGNK